jgi:hypothetical protein
MEETSHSCEMRGGILKVFCVPGGPNKKLCTNSGDTPALACIVFRKISVCCLAIMNDSSTYEGNGFVLFKDIDLTSTLKRPLQEYGCARHILTRAILTRALEQFTRFR